MPSSCKDIRTALAACLQESDCVMVSRNSAADCLREPLVNTLPPKCVQLKHTFGECKRGLIDMRKRFRGNMPISVSKELEGGGAQEGKMLYAGRPAYSSNEGGGGREKGPMSESDAELIERERQINAGTFKGDLRDKE
ncbi:hypothetical protein EJ05DRAFT_475122 [Pseudovirgaria hyperparasitica]|uniref:Cytochrome c oxidase assembly protein n=1 Tax=Pseudovirgaria hyperparasitica TaxID=470096 RepID=A0A6A6WCP0_9PEZI|nr:uncharacterized protein EJ05DRAFT_475122 [Pseudovirgaria hyperparasitica]KAF2758871.1 hypothetical protein EJ05DRAFT_475122 [Pseudovirgaria hyperparasitica]